MNLFDSKCVLSNCRKWANLRYSSNYWISRKVQVRLQVSGHYRAFWVQLIPQPVGSQHLCVPVCEPRDGRAWLPPPGNSSQEIAESGANWPPKLPSSLQKPEEEYLRIHFVWCGGFVLIPVSVTSSVSWEGTHFMPRKSPALMESSHLGGGVGWMEWGGVNGVGVR